MDSWLLANERALNQRLHVQREIAVDAFRRIARDLKPGSLAHQIATQALLDMDKARLNPALLKQEDHHDRPRDSQETMRPDAAARVPGTGPSDRDLGSVG